MTRRAAARRIQDREAQGAFNFDVALETYLEDGDAEDLLRAAGLVIGCTIQIDPTRADILAGITGTTTLIEDYDDAARAVRRWAALMYEDGARH
jgi:hypothetical protein